MIDPVYTAQITIGGSTHKYAFTALPTELLADQSLNLSVTVVNADNSPYDLSGATAEFFCTARNVSGLVPTNLGSVTLSDSGSGTVDTVSIVVPKDDIPDFLGDYAPTRTGSSVFYFQIQDADSYIQIYQYLNVTASNFSGDGSGNIQLPSSSLLYTPSVGGDWPDPDPSTVEAGLDGLADRVTIIESNPSAGDMTKAVYSPQGIEADAFDRNNMTGSQLASTISDFDTAISNSTAVSGTVTVHADMNSAGSGDVITTQERADLTTATSHVSNVNNPHNITPAQIGNTVAQFNADKIQDRPLPIPAGVADDQKSLNYDFTTDSFLLVTPAGAGGGEANDLSLDAGATGETIRITKTGSDIIIKGVTGANNVTVSTVGQDIVVDVIDSAENVRGAIAIANTATVNTGTDDTQAITTLKMTTKLANYQLLAPIIKTTSGVYSSTGDDAGKFVKVDNTLTLETLTEGHTCIYYNTTGSAISLVAGSGVSFDNTTDTQIKAKGTISVLYLDATTVVIDGNTEV